MSINLFALNASEATLVRQPIKPVSYRLNTDRIKENREQLKSESKDMIQISNESLAELKNVGELNRNYCNYSLTVFFTNDMPKITAADGSYLIDNVSFSKEELEQCRMVMKAAKDGISSGVGNLDYENHAKMGVAVSCVRTFAGDKLTEEQAAVVNKAMQEYNKALIEAEYNIMSDGNYTEHNYDGLSDYYGTARILNEGDVEALNKVKEELSRITGRTLTPSKEGDIVVVQSATNKELINTLTNLFADIDSTDEQAVNEAMKKYKELMRPAYIAYGMNDLRGSLTRVLNEDVADFKKHMDNILLAARYHATDYSV